LEHRLTRLASGDCTAASPRKRFDADARLLAIQIGGTECCGDSTATLESGIVG